jgi:predicted small lipoprotein YifL
MKRTRNDSHTGPDLAAGIDRRAAGAVRKELPMKRPVALALALLCLAACGVDGPPSPPPDERERPEPGITISGTVSAGVTGGSSRIRQ